MPGRKHSKISRKKRERTRKSWTEYLKKGRRKKRERTRKHWTGYLKNGRRKH